MFDALKSAFSNGVQNFELGLAGLEDAVGLTHDKAAAVYTEQSSTPFASTEAKQKALSDATAAEDAGKILGPAGVAAIEDVAQTGADFGKAVGHGVEGVASVVGKVESSLLGPLALPLVVVGVVALVGVALYFGPELKALAHRAGAA